MVSKRKHPCEPYTAVNAWVLFSHVIWLHTVIWSNWAQQYWRRHDNDTCWRFCPFNHPIFIPIGQAAVCLSCHFWGKKVHFHIMRLVSISLLPFVGSRSLKCHVEPMFAASVGCSVAHKNIDSSQTISGLSLVSRKGHFFKWLLCAPLFIVTHNTSMTHMTQ